MVLELPDRQLMRRFDYIINAATYTLSSPGKELDSWIAL
jgi:hypothetical protein